MQERVNDPLLHFYVKKAKKVVDLLASFGYNTPVWLFIVDYYVLLRPVSGC